MRFRAIPEKAEFIQTLLSLVILQNIAFMNILLLTLNTFINAYFTAVCTVHYVIITLFVQRGVSKTLIYELVNMRALKFSIFYENHIFQGMRKMFFLHKIIDDQRQEMKWVWHCGQLCVHQQVQGGTSSSLAKMTSLNGNVFRVTGPLWGESTGHRWIPLTKTSDTELWCFLWSAPEQTEEQTIEKRGAHYDVTVM